MSEVGREGGEEGKVRREEGKVRREEASEEILPNIYLFKKQVGGKEQSANGIKSASYFLDAFDVPEGFKLGHARPKRTNTWEDNLFRLKAKNIFVLLNINICNTDAALHLCSVRQI